MRINQQNYSIKHAKRMLAPGYIAVESKPALLSSVCANGIIVIIWDRVIRIGGMAHCVFPSLRGQQIGLINYYADVAVPRLIRTMLDNKGYHMVAQLLGGASLSGVIPNRVESMIKVIKLFLKKCDIDVVSEDIGGKLGRKVMFDTHSGEVLVLKTRNIRKADWWPE